MKSVILKLLASCMVCITVLACGPSIHYLGDSHQPTLEVDVFYDPDDIGVPYTTIGRMTHDKFINYDANAIKQAMLKTAREKGADGILFLDAYTEWDSVLNEDRLSVQAKLIKYSRG